MRSDRIVYHNGGKDDRVCILKMINVNPDKRHNSVWDLITDLDIMK